MNNTPFLAGDLCYLRALLPSDLAGPMATWENDFEVRRYLFRGLRPAHPEAIRRAAEASRDSERDVEFAVIRSDSDTHVGVTGIHSVNWVARTGEFRILIGARDAWGTGLGTEATQLTVAYAFESLNLNRVWLGVNAEHASAIHLYEKCGFVREGVLRQEYYRHRKYFECRADEPPEA